MCGCFFGGVIGMPKTGHPIEWLPGKKTETVNIREMHSSCRCLLWKHMYTI